ncbi:MAG: hypothetical protein V1775_05550 [Bacteroidota bacterium]
MKHYYLFSGRHTSISVKGIEPETTLFSRNSPEIIEVSGDQERIGMADPGYR